MGVEKKVPLYLEQHKRWRRLVSTHATKSQDHLFFHGSICLYIYIHILIQRQEQMSVSFACVHGLFNVGELMSLGGGKIDASPSAPSCVSWEFRQRRFFYPSFQNGNPFVKRNINLSLSIVIVTPVFFSFLYSSSFSQWWMPMREETSAVELPFCCVVAVLVFPSFDNTNFFLLFEISCCSFFFVAWRIMSLPCERETKQKKTVSLNF